MLVRTVLFALAFALATAVGRATVVPESNLALFWPAAGIAALWGVVAPTRRQVLAVALVVGVISGGGNVLTGFPVLAGIVLGAANAVIAVGCRGVMSWLRRYTAAGVDRNRLTRLRDVYRFVAATAASVILSTPVGMFGLELAGTAPRWEDALLWVVRNAAAVVVIAGPGLAVRDTRGQVTRARLLESLPTLLVTLATLWFVFGPGHTLPLSFLPIALVLWSALRLPLPLAAAQGLVVAVGTFALVRGVDGGPFGAIGSGPALAVTLQAYMLVVVALSLVIATVQWERDRLLDEVAQAALDASHQADHDALTGLPNRRRLDAALQQHRARTGPDEPVGALLLVDLDNFKEVNDTLGHAAGDELIVTVAEILRGSLRENDLVARLGGDEFAVLLPEADQAGARVVAHGIVERIRHWSSAQGGVRRRVTASIGVATFAAAAQRGVAPLVLADMLLYDAKEAGRDRLAVLGADGADEPRTGARLEVAARVEEAIARDVLTLHLQPVLDLRTLRIVGAEALVRLTDGGTHVSASEFVDAAERAGLASRLDCCVVRKGVAVLAGLHDRDPGLSLALNVSSHSVGDPALEATLTGALEDHAVAAGRLVLEITETAAVADLASVRAFGDMVGALGARVAIDDFGAGHGSFQYLKHLPFDIVKIDGGFVEGSPLSSTDQAILRSVVGLARDLGARTVAEFVTDDSVLAVVQELGVDLAQGYLVGEPVPVEEFVTRYLPGGTGRWTTEGPQPRAVSRTGSP
ncbi:EAL domain-containing protein [Phycicoccus sp. CSK15P-2]|uniref:putative bifunctional diguanylate cyclase/phosphodiesterase n=1 Tax=Phycicoccus sp. CSK15P-2 TaxID=2807627 RepID=UPI00195087D9|nr:EAL domain-containing protein [Phycicoccus sp. CSK15P-2]MBM6403268.1 EAL domain-containing protein [Phycicoccus sp. CSK15P-2]